MTRLILVRHGNTFERGQPPTQIGSRTDLPLTEMGKLQAEQMGRFLQSENIHPAAIYRGPLKRQIETAGIIGQILNIDHRLESVLSEIDYGPWEGLTSEQIGEKWPREYADWTEQALWAEGIFGGTRPISSVEQWVARLKKMHRPEETVLAVSSNGLIRYFYGLLKKEWDQLIQDRKMETIKVKTGHFCELSIGEEEIRIKRWNVQPRLAQKV